MLLNKEVSLFLCCGFVENAQNYFDTNFDRTLLKHCTLKSCFGGELHLTQLKWVDKMIIKLVSHKYALKTGEISQENIHKFAQILRSEAKL